LGAEVKVASEPQADLTSNKTTGKLWRGQLMVMGKVFPDRFPTNLDKADVATLQNYVWQSSQIVDKGFQDVTEQQTAA
jgi:hypothetical protein